MKRIEAIIRTHKLRDVLAALDKHGVPGLTVVDIVGYGRQRGFSEVYRGSDESFGLVHKRMLILYVQDQEVEGLVRCIGDAARTGKVGDGKLVVSDVEHALRIRTGEEIGATTVPEL